MLTLEKTNGLDQLVQEIESGKTRSVLSSWTTWFERAVRQLEEDDSIDARFTDVLAESLEEIDAALAEGFGVEFALKSFVSLYHRHEKAVSVESRWRRRISELGRVQIETGLWLDLEAALEAAAGGQTIRVAHWLKQMRAKFQNAWDSYQDSDILICEVTEESQTGHRLLGEGIQAWIRAFEKFHQGLDGTVDKKAVRAEAEQGQRLLVGLQVIQAESKDCTDHFRAAWAN